MEQPPETPNPFRHEHDEMWLIRLLRFLRILGPRRRTGFPAIDESPLPRQAKTPRPGADNGDTENQG